MSDQPALDRSRLEQRRDAGMTLPELLISITVLGMIVTALMMTVIVTLKTADGTEGRINVAAAEQSIGFDLPSDLASAATVDTNPAATPCGTACPADLNLNGSNALLLTWTTTRPNASGSAAIQVVTNVSYYFAPSSVPGVFELRRIECVSEDGGAWNCNSRVVLRDLDGPPGGGTFVAGDTVPYWVIQVSVPLAPDAVSTDQLADASTLKDANRVVVTISGGGSVDGNGGGVNQIAITAGGTSRRTIPADSTVNAPTFQQARSKCGGPVTLIVDNSGSIIRNPYTGSYDYYSNLTSVENGVRAFIDAFAGTPTQLQIVKFSSESAVIGDTAWTKYYDMTDPDQVDYLRSQVDPALTASGGTNWEDGFFRTFYEPNGTLQQVLPETVVFFTDGEPTLERLNRRAGPGVVLADSPPAPEPGWTKYNSSGNVDQVNGTFWSNGREFSQVAFNRADWIVDQVRGSVKVIGVGVGGIDTAQSEWVINPGARYDIRYEQGYRQYKRVTTSYQKRQTINYQKRNSSWSSWYNISFATYVANNTTPDSTDNYRISIPTSGNSWQTISQSTYNAGNLTSDELDGYRVVNSETWITKATYDANNTTGDASDGYYDAGKVKVTSDSEAMDWELDLSLTADAGGVRSTKIASPTGAYSDAPDTQVTDNEVILSRIVAGNDNAVRGEWDADGNVTNARVAEMYVLPEWNQLASALFAIAMAECGGTVTVSTKVNGAGRAPDPFTFQNSQVTTAGTPPVPLDVEPTVVTTSISNPTRTFDFDMTDGLGRIVDIIPHDLSSLTGYAPASTPWTCRSGITELTSGQMQLLPIAGEAWTGVRLLVAPNTAVSCTLNVTR